MSTKSFLLIFLLIPVVSFSQGLLDELEDPEEPATEYTRSTFKTTRLVSGHSIETLSDGVLQFLISHRFDRLNQGFYDFFGLDGATIRLGLEYGINDRLNLGFGRSSYEKTYDGLVKYKLLRQSTGEVNMPVTLTLLSSVAFKTVRWPDPDREFEFTSRLFYTYQALVARKFNQNLSLQIMPTLIHRNIVSTVDDNNLVFAMGIGGRYNITGATSINAEYYYLLPGQIESPFAGSVVRNTLSIGFDIHTGGHVFQLHFTNSRGMIEKMLITETTGDWFDGDIHFGFNISRVFGSRPR